MSRKTTLPTYAAPTELPPSSLAGVKGQHVTQSDAQNDQVYALAKKHWATGNQKVKWSAKVVEEIAADYLGSATWDGRKVMLLELLQYLEKVSLVMILMEELTIASKHISSIVVFVAPFRLEQKLIRSYIVHLYYDK